MDIKEEADIDWLKIEVDELPEQPQTSTISSRDCWDYEEPLLTTRKIPEVVEDTTDTRTLTDLHTCDICLSEFKDKFILKEHIKSVHTDMTWDYATMTCTASDSKAEPIICNNLPNRCNSPPNNNDGHSGDCNDVMYCDVVNLPTDTKNLNEDSNGQIYMYPNYSKNARDNFRVRYDVMLDVSFDDSGSLENQKITHKDKTMDDIDSINIISSDEDNTVDTSIHARENAHECAFCDYQSARSSDLQRHILKHTGEKPYKCTLCDFKSKRNHDLKIHMVRHTGDKPYRCFSCDYKCARKSELNMHMMKHTGEKPYKCTLCDYECTTNFSLKSHMVRHSGAKPYRCTLCDYICARKSGLNMHMVKHTGDKPHICTLCDYKCARSWDLEKHMMKHTGDMPHKCPLCDFKCARISDLTKNHMVKHTGEKPYKCTLCDYKCARSCDLNRHMVKHTGEKPYECTLCDCKFAQSSNLKRHLVKHTGEKPYKCSLCDYKCARSRNLKNHMVKHTGEKSLTSVPCVKVREDLI